MKQNPNSKRKQPRKQIEPPAKGRDGDKYVTRAVTKALDIVELLQTRQSPMTLNEISTEIQLSKTSAFRLLRTLEAAGWLRTNGNGSYNFVPEIRSTVPPQFIIRLLRVATPLLKELSETLRETVSLGVLFENRIEVIAVIESPELIRMSNVVGHIVPLNASSLGKVITAFQEQERREKLVRSVGSYRFTNQTITDRVELAREFQRVRNQGFAVDREESVNDGCCFAVPIRSDSGGVPAALSVSMPKARLGDGAHEKAIVDALRATADQISAVM